MISIAGSGLGGGGQSGLERSMGALGQPAGRGGGIESGPERWREDGLHCSRCGGAWLTTPQAPNGPVSQPSGFRCIRDLDLGAYVGTAGIQGIAVGPLSAVATRASPLCSGPSRRAGQAQRRQQAPGLHHVGKGACRAWSAGYGACPPGAGAGPAIGVACSGYCRQATVGRTGPCLPPLLRPCRVV